MKKIIIILFIISSLYIFNNSSEIIIPKEAIRFRIIANSNSIEDQKLKNTIKKDLIENVIPKVDNKSLYDYKQVLKTTIPTIQEAINKYNIEYNISLGNNYFPEKEYKGIKYPSGYYDSLIITLGNGIGDNFWCVLYPPLCLIEDANTDNIEYKSIIKETIDTYFNNY